MAKPKRKNIILTTGGLRYKLMLAFSLMSILPLLVSTYIISTYVLPKVGFQIDVTVSLLISVFIAVIGFLVVKEIFDRILSVTTDAKLMAGGDYSRIADVLQKDEVGDLSQALNDLTNRIRSNIDELKNYGEKTVEVNIEIQKRVLVLSSLLQITSMISKGEAIDDILKFAIEKSLLLADADSAYLLFREEGQEIFYMKVAEGKNVKPLLQIRIHPDNFIFAKLIKENKTLIVDKQNILPQNLREEFQEKFRIKNILALPLYLKGRVAGIVGIGSTQEQYLYKIDNVELLDIFVKQIAIALKNDILTHDLEKLEIKDALTGLYNERFIRERLDEEIKRAVIYHRPCAFIVLNIDDFEKLQRDFGPLYTEGILKKSSTVIKDSVTGVCLLGRTSSNEFSVILPERNKTQAQRIAEEVRKKIEFTFGIEQDINKRITVSGGISENPIDGMAAAELFGRARESLANAQTQGKNRIGI